MKFMSLYENGSNNMVMPVSPMANGYGNGLGFGDGARSPTTGRYMSYDDGYSGHSIHDRMIAALENLMDGAESNYEREVISNGIRMIRQYER